MKCPACVNQLSELVAGEVTVDVCRGGCGGVWFDNREIRKFDEDSEVEGEKILAVEVGSNVIKNQGNVRYCPKCSDEVLCRRFYDIKNQVEVDQCLKCSGIWLDTGELNTIRHQYKTEKDRYAAADIYLDDQLKITENEIKNDFKNELTHWKDDTSFKGILRNLFGGLF